MSLFSPEMSLALTERSTVVMFAVRLEWPNAVIRLHSEVGTFSHFPFDEGEPYLGAGILGGIGDIQYGDGDETLPSVTLELSAFDDAVREQILAGGYQGKRGQLYMLVANETGEIRAWSELFNGVMDSGTVVQGKGNKISLPLICPDDGLDVGMNERCTNESHKAKFKQDEFYKYTQYMEDFVIYFGNKKDGIPLREF